jgi:excalibur calcium-binding domain-containing protein
VDEELHGAQQQVPAWSWQGEDTRQDIAEPVTNFKRNTRLYNVAMSYNKGLDRDKDGIACEND